MRDADGCWLRVSDDDDDEKSMARNGKLKHPRKWLIFDNSTTWSHCNLLVILKKSANWLMTNLWSFKSDALSSGFPKVVLLSILYLWQSLTMWLLDSLLKLQRHLGRFSQPIFEQPKNTTEILKRSIKVTCDNVIETINWFFRKPV